MAELKKCIVLDLDGTLWGGVIGEDGKDGILLSMDEKGEHFIAFQQGLRDLHDRGIILAINSKNNPDDALDVIRTHPNMVLKEHHFAATRINWNDKVQNMRELAEELNIGLDSMVFLDDSTLQREAIKSALPEVAVPEMPVDSALYTEMLLSLPYFKSDVLTDEDKMRGNFYVTERLRTKAETRFESRQAFLDSLGLAVRVVRNDRNAAPRIAQLTEKTNQFNTNKIPKTEEEIQTLMESPDTEVFYAEARDRYGDHGIIAAALVQKNGVVWNVDTLLMSCRVFERGIEDAFVYAIAEAAQKEGGESLVFDFTPTEKNDPAKLFLQSRTQGGILHNADAALPPWITIL
ncbi:MAG: HAD-IIIC family phosphatase [Candidatus Adlerbacteria bacterium]